MTPYGERITLLVPEFFRIVDDFHFPILWDVHLGKSGPQGTDKNTSSHFVINVFHFSSVFERRMWMSSSVLIFLKFGTSLSYSRWIGSDQRIPFHPCSFSFGRRRPFWQRGDRRGRARSRESRCDLLLWFGEYYETGWTHEFLTAHTCPSITRGVSSGAQVQLGLRQRFFCSKEVLKKVRKRKLKRISLFFITANIRRDRKGNEK